MFEKTLVIVGNADLTTAKSTQKDLWCTKDNTLDSFMVSRLKFSLQLIPTYWLKGLLWWH